MKPIWFDDGAQNWSGKNAVKGDSFGKCQLRHKWVIALLSGFYSYKIICPNDYTIHLTMEQPHEVWPPRQLQRDSSNVRLIWQHHKKSNITVGSRFDFFVRKEKDSEYSEFFGHLSFWRDLEADRHTMIGPQAGRHECVCVCVCVCVCERERERESERERERGQVSAPENENKQLR